MQQVLIYKTYKKKKKKHSGILRYYAYHCLEYKVLKIHFNRALAPKTFGDLLLFSNQPHFTKWAGSRRIGSFRRARKHSKLLVFLGNRTADIGSAQTPGFQRRAKHRGLA